MAKKRESPPHRFRPGEAVVVTTSDGGQAVLAPLSLKGRVHILPAPGTMIRRLKAEADDRANDDCEGKR